MENIRNKIRGILKESRGGYAEENKNATTYIAFLSFSWESAPFIKIEGNMTRQPYFALRGRGVRWGGVGSQVGEKMF